MALLSITVQPMGSSPPAWRRGLIRWSKPASFDPKRRCLVVSAAKERKKIDGATEQMNQIASQNLDFSPARRRVREAFTDAQKELDHFLFKMAPNGITMEENYDKNSKGVELFWKKWLPRSDVAVKGTLFFCHGYGDTCTFFFEGIAKRIADAGYGVYAMDYPGFGLSEGLHGYIPSFDGMVDQLIEQYSILKGLQVGAITTIYRIIKTAFF